MAPKSTEFLSLLPLRQMLKKEPKRRNREKWLSWHSTIFLSHSKCCFFFHFKLFESKHAAPVSAMNRSAFIFNDRRFNNNLRQRNFSAFTFPAISACDEKLYKAKLFVGSVIIQPRMIINHQSGFFFKSLEQ